MVVLQNCVNVARLRNCCVAVIAACKNLVVMSDYFPSRLKRKQTK
jgi:hypothetical protein